jgi:hypothetical protein
LACEVGGAGHDVLFVASVRHFTGADAAAVDRVGRISIVPT